MAIISGTEGPDVLEGTKLPDDTPDTINGKGGGDTLFGFGGADILNGGLGDDVLDGGLGSDLLNGESGFDAASYATAGAAVTVTLGIGTVDPTRMEGASSGGGGTDTLRSIEAVHGSDFNDRIEVTARVGEEIFLRGNGGADTLIGPSTRDAGVWATYFTATQGIVATFQASGPGYRFTVQDGTPIAAGGAAATDTLINIWSLAGSSFDDRFTGGDDGERFIGRGGNDTIDGQGGSDWAEYDTSPGGIFVNLTSGFASDGYGSTDTLLRIENIRASNSSDQVIGSGVANSLLGLDGNDFLEGGAGADTIDGGRGTDTASYAGSAAAVAVKLAAGQAFGGDAQGDVLSGIENLTGSAFADNLAGDAGVNILRGEEGDDVLAGGFGADQLFGGNGNDHLDGGDGADILAGDAGSDTYLVDNALDQVVETGSDFDRVVTRVSYTLGSGVEELVADPAVGHAPLALTGNGLANVITGNGSANRLDGAAGADVLAGGAGNDTYVVGDLGDVVIDAAANGTDTILTSVSYALSSGAEIEVLRLIDPSSKAKIALTGNNFANAITGGAGVNTIKGLGGHDVIDAGAGKDVVNGGAGNDFIVGGRGLDKLTGSSGRDKFAFERGDTGASKKTADYITDFSGRRGDKVDLHAIDANVKAKGNQAFKFIGDDAFTKAGQVRYEKVGKATYLSYSTDADSAAEGVIKIKGAVDFHKGWFVL